LLAECRRRGVTLGDMIKHIVVHEVGHHFGLSDDDMHAIEDEA
jgi:predicted Zn-dependent protease with MMP-like domain